MKVKIETYRKFDIFFDTEAEAFSSIVHEVDEFSDAKVLKESKSYAAVKKAIDEYIKENNTFEPFFVRIKPGAYSFNKDRNRIKIVGIRKDNRFIAEDNKGQQFQVSEYDEKDYILEYPEDEIYFATIAALELEIDELREKIKQAKNAVKTESLNELKVNYKK